jgi:hypothetical protein
MIREAAKWEKLTLNHPSLNLVPDTVAGDGDIFADCRRVVDLGAVELVAEQHGLVIRLEGVCWCGIAAAMGESEEGGYDADEEVVSAHVVGGAGVAESVV